MILSIYCYFRDFERSVDGVIADPGSWPFFTNYLKQRLESFESLLAGAARPAIHIKDFAGQINCDCKSVPHVNVARLILNRIYYSVSRNVFISKNELEYIACSYKLICELSKLKSFDPGRALSIRTAMYNSQFIIRRNTLGKSLIYISEHVEHFNQSPYVKHFKISEIVDKARQAGKT